MKKIKSLYIGVLLLVTGLGISSFSCSKGDEAGDLTNTKEIMGIKIKIRVNSKIFTATLTDNSTAMAFKALLPLTLKMDDINGNEKKYDFPKSFPGKSVNPGTINIGDLMIWSENTLVLFYKSFSTSYSYVKIGHIDDALGLEAALGGGSVTIIYELAN